jgi:hypothetical protein
MNRKIIFFFLLVGFQINAFSQNVLAECAISGIDTASHVNALPQLVRTVLQNANDKKLIMMGELHQVQINCLVQLEMIKQLSNDAALVVLEEFAHSLCFLENKFLETGDEQYLKMIDSTDAFPAMHWIYAHNKSVVATKQIKFAGIDYEINDKANNESAFKKSFRNAIEVLRTQTKMFEVDSVFNEYMLLVQTTNNGSALANLLGLMKDRLNNLKEEQKTVLGKDYHDLYLILNSETQYRPSRDDAMMDKLIYIEKNIALPNAKFFVSIGAGHAMASSSQNLRYRLDQAISVFKNNHFQIGLQYINCKSRFFGKRQQIDNTGVFDLITNTKTSTIFADWMVQNNLTLAAIPQTILDCLKPLHRNIAKKQDAYLLFRNFDAADNWKLR